MTKRYVNQWGIYIVDFGKPCGSVQGGTRLAVVLQNCIGNQFSPTTICVPLTTQHKKNLPTHYNLYHKDYDFLTDSIVLCEQVCTIDIKEQVKGYKGMLNNNDRKNLYNTFSNNFILQMYT
jgi:mRNA interferase MazF